MYVYNILFFSAIYIIISTIYIDGVIVLLMIWMRFVYLYLEVWHFICRELHSSRASVQTSCANAQTCSRNIQSQCADTKCSGGEYILH